MAQSTVADVVVMAVEERKSGVPQLDPDVMVKFVFEISKKIFPTASTLIRAVVLGVLGIVTTCDPSLGVLAINVVKVFPPSVDNDIFTLAQLTGAAVVLLTDQVTV